MCTQAGSRQPSSNRLLDGAHLPRLVLLTTHFSYASTPKLSRFLQQLNCFSLSSSAFFPFSLAGEVTMLVKLSQGLRSKAARFNLQTLLWFVKQKEWRLIVRGMSGVRWVSRITKSQQGVPLFPKPNAFQAALSAPFPPLLEELVHFVKILTERTWMENKKCLCPLRDVEGKRTANNEV